MESTLESWTCQKVVPKHWSLNLVTCTGCCGLLSQIYIFVCVSLSLSLGQFLSCYTRFNCKTIRDSMHFQLARSFIKKPHQAWARKHRSKASQSISTNEHAKRTGPIGQPMFFGNNCSTHNISRNQCLAASRAGSSSSLRCTGKLATIRLSKMHSKLKCCSARYRVTQQKNGVRASQEWDRTITPLWSDVVISSKDRTSSSSQLVPQSIFG